MNSEAWREIEGLFALAGALSPGEREARIRAEASSPEIALEVLALLRAADHPGIFDDLTRLQDLREAGREGLAPGTRLGAWEVVEPRLSPPSMQLPPPTSGGAAWWTESPPI